MFGSVGAWFYQALAGINVAGDSAGDVGYRHIRIEPQIVEDLEEVSASVETVRGKVTCHWTHSSPVVSVEVTVPVNAEAKVVVPKDVEMTEITIQEGGRTVWEKGRYVAGVPGVTGATGDRDGVTFNVGSGHYSFKLTGE